MAFPDRAFLLVLVRILNKYKGGALFGAAFIALCLLTMNLPGSANHKASAANGTTPVTCGTYDCHPTAPDPNAGAPATTAAPGAAPAPAKTSNPKDPDAAWGTPVREDDFNGPLDTSSNGWYIYNSPNSSPPREPGNVAVHDGFVWVDGTYANGHNVGSGVSMNFGQKYGRWEVRARADVGAGFSPTILLWPDSEKWPQDGEIDLLESPHGSRKDGIAVLHNGAGNSFKTHGISGSQNDWHTYAVNWFPDHITFYVDNVEQWTVTTKSLIPTTSSMHLVLQNDAGCGWIQCPNSSTKANTEMQVDWIKVYALPKS